MQTSQNRIAINVKWQTLKKRIHTHKPAKVVAGAAVSIK